MQPTVLWMKIRKDYINLCSCPFKFFFTSYYATGSLKVNGENSFQLIAQQLPSTSEKGSSNRTRDAPSGEADPDELLSIRSESVPDTHEFLKYKRKGIVGSDDRIHVKPAQTQMLPFKAVVKVKMSAQAGSCSGVLIGPRHVLSAAHCFHNGSGYLTPLRALKVGILQRNERFTLYSVEHVFLPSALVQARRVNPEYDYAVLTLQRPHGRPFLQILAMSMKNLLRFSTMHFACFPNDKLENTMWYSSCPVGWQPDSSSYRTVIMNKCDAAGGCSGAGVYVWDRSSNNRYIIGVLSSTVNKKPKNVVTRLTSKKVKEICRWIGWLKKSGCRRSTS